MLCRIQKEVAKNVFAQNVFPKTSFTRSCVIHALILFWRSRVMWYIQENFKCLDSLFLLQLSVGKEINTPRRTKLCWASYINSSILMNLSTWDVRNIWYWIFSFVFINHSDIISINCFFDVEYKILNQRFSPFLKIEKFRI